MKNLPMASRGGANYVPRIPLRVIRSRSGRCFNYLQRCFNHLQRCFNYLQRCFNYLREMLQPSPEMLQLSPEMLQPSPEMLQLSPEMLQLSPEMLQLSPGDASTISGRCFNYLQRCFNYLRRCFNHLQRCFNYLREMLQLSPEMLQACRRHGERPRGCRSRVSRHAFGGGGRAPAIGRRQGGKAVTDAWVLSATPSGSNTLLPQSGGASARTTGYHPHHLRWCAASRNWSPVGDPVRVDFYRPYTLTYSGGHAFQP